MRVYWKVRTIHFPSLSTSTLTHDSQFIEGMLTNLGSLSLDRIQGMLKLAPGYDRTIDQLASFMEAARREELVTTKDGMWRLNR
jgi:anaphase-promoting complex subunit 2